VTQVYSLENWGYVIVRGAYVSHACQID